MPIATINAKQAEKNLKVWALSRQVLKIAEHWRFSVNTNKKPNRMPKHDLHDKQHTLMPNHF